VGLFGQGVEHPQLIGVRQRIGVVARLLGEVRQLDQRAAQAAAAAFALLRDPGVKFTTELGVAFFTEHAVGFAEVMLDAFSQRECHDAHHEFCPELLLQLEQSLAQGIARVFEVAVGPQQHGQARARRRPFECQPR